MLLYIRYLVEWVRLSGFSSFGRWTILMAMVAHVCCLGILIHWAGLCNTGQEGFWVTNKQTTYPFIPHFLISTRNPVPPHTEQTISCSSTLKTHNWGGCTKILVSTHECSSKNEWIPTFSLFTSLLELMCIYIYMYVWSDVTILKRKKYAKNYIKTSGFYLYARAYLR